METRHLHRLGQVGEFVQDNNTGSEQYSTTDSHNTYTLAPLKFGKL